MNGETIAVIIIGIIVAIIAYASHSSEQKRIAEEDRKKYGRLKRRIDAYNDYLIKECGFEIPSVSNEPMAEEMDVMNYMAWFSEYEREHKKLGIKASVEIDHLTYDIRESKVNKLEIENDELKHRLYDLEMQAFFIRDFLDDFSEDGHSKMLENSWKKFAKNYKIEDSIPNWYYLLGSSMLSGEVDDVDGIIQRAKKRGEPLTEEKIKDLEERAELQRKQNELYEEYLEYKKHDYCYGNECNEGEDLEKCIAIRKRFHRFFDDEI